VLPLINTAFILTNTLRGRPSYLTQFLLRNRVVSLEDRYCLVAGHGHDAEIIIPCFAEVVHSTVAEVMKCKVLNLCFLTGRLKAVFNFIKWLSMSEKNSVRMKTSW
jgi:hypothetical protein